MRLRRRRGDEVVEADADETLDAAHDGEVAAGPRADGPWDDSERPVDPDDEKRAHLGALSLEVNPEVEFRLQVDEASGEVQAVMVVAADGAMELRAFAAPRHEDTWDDVRGRLQAEAQRRGGSAEEVPGPYGPALRLSLSGVSPDGKQVVQDSLVLGISGPRWLLRVSLFGRPATEFDPDGVLETALRGVVVHRGTEPMAPGDPLRLVLPSGARRMGPPS